MSNRPSARTSNVCGSTSIFGIAAFRTMSVFESARTDLIGTIFLATPS
jgi:hypothetical protein